MLRFEELIIWRESINYGKGCYEISKTLPKFEMFALGNQLRRAALSVSNNVAEGSVGSSANFKKYINISIGSILETVNILTFANEIGYIGSNTKNSMYEKAEILIKQMRSFSKSLK